jgi:uncharacterized protein
MNSTRSTAGQAPSASDGGARREADAIHDIVYRNPLAVYGLNTEMKEEHWLAPPAIDQRTLYEGNSVLRGGQTPRIDQPVHPAE